MCVTCLSRYLNDAVIPFSVFCELFTPHGPLDHWSNVYITGKGKVYTFDDVLCPELVDNGLSVTFLSDDICSCGTAAAAA